MDVAVGSKWATSVRPTDTFPEGTTGLGAGGIIVSPGGSPNESVSTSGGRYGVDDRGFNMYPMAEAILFVKTMGTSDGTNYCNPLTCMGDSDDSLEAQRAHTRRAELQAIPGSCRRSRFKG